MRPEQGRLKDKANSKMAKGKDGVTVVHSPFNSLDQEDDGDAVEVGKVVGVGVGVGKKKHGNGKAKKTATQEERGKKTGKTKKKQDSTGTAQPDSTPQSGPTRP